MFHIGRLSARGGLVLVVAAAGALVVADDGRAAAVAPRDMTFIDRDSGLALVLQVAPNARDAGAFIFRVPGIGLYEGKAGGAMRAVSASSVVLDYRGPATLGPQVTFDTASTPASPVVIDIRLQAQVDPTRRTAEATLTDATHRYHLVVRNIDKGALLQTLQAFETATLKNDWTVLYGLMNSDVRAAYTTASFAAQGASQVNSVGSVIALRRMAVGEVQSDDNGAMFVLVTYGADIRGPGGTVRTSTYDVAFIPEQTSWRMWYSASH